MLEFPPATKAHYTEVRTLLRSASARRKSNSFVVEGPVLVAELMASDFEPLYILGDPELLKVHAHTGVDLFDAPAGRLAEALSTQSPRAIAAVAALPVASPIAAGGSLALVEMSDPGNCGTMIRTAEAAGMTQVVMVGDCADPWNPKVVRASAGAVMRIPVVRCSEDQLFAASAGSVVATVVSGGSNYLAAPLAHAVICLGNEAHGLSEAFVRRCDALVTIPLAGPTESLNVAAAAAVMAFAALEQRRSDSPLASTKETSV